MLGHRVRSLSKHLLPAALPLAHGLARVAGIMQLASAAASASNVRKGDPYTDFSPILAIPALFTDMVFLTWICELFHTIGGTI